MRSWTTGWVISAALVASGCGGEAPEGSSSTEERAELASGAVARSPAEAPPAARIRYDLARHIARAELRHAGARVIDLGAPSGHQHTLGGWRTRTGDVAEIEGVRASVVRHVTGFYLLPIESPERCHLSMRARGFADERVALYLDNRTIGTVRVPTDGSWSIAHADIPEELCTPGEHDLRVRVSSTARGAGVAIDWIRLGAPGPAAEIAPPSVDELAPQQGTRLAIGDDWTVAYSFEVPAGARLRGIARGAGRLEITAERDGSPLRQLETLQATERGAAFDIDLGSLASHVVRLSLTARGAVTLIRPAVVTLDATEPRSLPRVRNVLVYLTDTLRADHLRPYTPATRVQTPGLSTFAERAATFLAAHAQENWTKPSCATLLSGLYPWEHRATGEDSQVPGSVELTSEYLLARGFFTGAFVANGFVSDRFGFRQGWNTFRNYVREGRRNTARFVAADVLRWLDERPADRPFFLYVHTVDPHVPYIPPNEDLRRYDPDPYDGVVDFHRDRQLLEGVKGGRIALNARDRVRLEALYDGEITYHDRHFASVMEALDRRGLAEDTLVVFTSDHGEEFFDHGSVGHGHSVFEELIRVPLIIRWPGLTDRPLQLSEAVGLVDVMPTLLTALGLEIPEELSGRSIAPLLREDIEDAPRPTVTGFMEGWRAIVVGRYKLVQRTTDRWTLYDLADDPGEQHDLASQRPIAVRYLRGLLGLSLAGAEHPTPGRTRHEEVRTEIDDTLRAQLEALGYAGASRAGTDDGT